MGTELNHEGWLSGESSADAQRQQQMSVMLHGRQGNSGREVREGCSRPELVSTQHLSS